MIKLGPAGSHGLGNLEGIKHCKELKLTAMEVEFTYGVRMGISEAKKVGELAKKLGIRLSIHAPYYINLNSAEKAKITASKKRILDSCERGSYFGKKVPIVFHAAFYGKKEPEECYQNVKKAIVEMQAVIKAKKWDVMLAPETTGKKSQFGNIEELRKLSKETGCSFCIDFAHLLARDGKRNYKELLDVRLKGVKKMHCHFSGIEYTAKGERRHKLTGDAELKELITELKKRNISAVIINESPDGYKDSVKGLKYL